MRRESYPAGWKLACKMAACWTLGVLFLLAGGCTRPSVNVEPPTNDPEFAQRLQDLAKDVESMDAGRVATHYASDSYSLSFDQPFKFDTGLDSSKTSVQNLVGLVKEGKVSLGSDTQVWKRDSGKVWTLRPVTVDATLKNGDIFKFQGKHSAIWEQRDGRWVIVYEHFWGDPELKRAQAAAELAPPVTAPAPKAAPLPPLGSIEEAQGYLKDIFFDLDKWNIREDQRATFEANLDFLKKYPGVEFTIEGHCDDRASKPYNIELGRKRANEVRDFLVAGGVDASRVKTVTLGKGRPFAGGKDEESRQLNRRAHFVVTKK